MPAVAMTDHGNLFGAVKFYEAARSAASSPSSAAKSTWRDTNRFDRSPDADRPYHFVLLCENERGYQNLVKLVSAAYTEGYYYKPRIDKDLLSRHSEGLIGLSACLRGEVAVALSADRYEAAMQSAHDLQDIFGKGNFFLEIQDQGMPMKSTRSIPTLCACRRKPASRWWPPTTATTSPKRTPTPRKCWSASRRARL